MNLDRLTAIWTRVRDNLWFLPAVLTLGAVILAMVTIQLDMADVFDFPEPPADTEPDGPGPLRLAFAGTADGARNVLNAIATGLITVTGVVFSVTIVALQLASTQFTPRILRNFTADRGNQLVLGVFIATFTYALLIQRVVRGEDGAMGSFVPHLSVTVALVLALVSIGFLIFFIDHAARSVQAAVIIDRVAEDGHRRIERTLRDLGTEGEVVREEVAPPPGPGTVVESTANGYLQGVDRTALLELLSERGRTIRIEPHVGDYIMRGGTLATLWPAADPEGELAERIRAAFFTGYERTPHLDIELAVVELVDIAVKALSPGINDPTTATICLDRLTELVTDLGRREPAPAAQRHPESGALLILSRPSFEHFVETALNQIRHFGAGNPHFAASMMRRLAQAGRLVPAERHAPLRRQAEDLLRDALAHGPGPADEARVAEAAAEAFAVLGGGAPPAA